MTRVRMLVSRLAALFRKNSLESEMDEEIRSHLEMQAEDNERLGMTADEARRAALRSFGSVDLTKERYRDRRGLPVVETILRDFRHGLRSMAKYPIACAVAVISLAAGIGATTATLTIRNALFRNPPPLSQDPEQLFEAFMPTPQRAYRARVPAGVFVRWKEQTGLHSGIAAARPSAMRNVRTAEILETAPVAAVTPDVFSVLGVAPELGRGFSGPSTAVLSYRLWQRMFGGREDVLGSVLWIDDVPYAVAGVMPQRFWFSDLATAIWTPMDVNTLPADALLEVVVRRPSNVTGATLTAGLQNDVTAYAAGLPENERQARVQIVQLVGTPIGRQIAPGAVWLLGACVFLTLVIACTNVAVLMIAQWTAREREIAVRAALGGSRGRIVRALLAESVLLALFGGIFGICATFALLGISLSRGRPDFIDFSIDGYVLAQMAAITLLAGILSGIAPALYETRRLQTNPLRLIPSDRVRQRWRHALVVFEITATIALLVVTSTMIDGYRRALSADLGYNIEPLLTARVEGPQNLGILEIRDRLNAVPGVESAAATTVVPMRGGGRRQRVAGDSAGSNALVAERAIVSFNFFATLGVPIRRGREFVSREDLPGALPVAIVNEALAERMWPGGEPVGMQLWTEGRGYEVVGVVANHLNTPLMQPFPGFYLPLSQGQTAARMGFIVRASGDPAGLVEPMRNEIRRLDSKYVVSEAFTLRSVAAVIGEEILAAVYPMTPLIAIGLLLTSAGIYSVLAFAITRRSRELAIRIAVGASGRQLVRLVATLSFRLTGLGILLGIGTTFGLSRFIQGMGGVFDTPSLAVFVAPVLIVAAVGVSATWVPSRRASSIDPAVLLRSE